MGNNANADDARSTGLHAAETSFAGHLLSVGRANSDALARAQQVSAESGEKFEHVLTRLGIITERERAEAFATFLGLPIAQAQDYPAAPVLAQALSPRFLREAQFLPLEERKDGVVVAFANPLDTYAIDAIRFAVGRQVMCRVAYPADLEAAYQRLYGNSEVAVETTPARNGQSGFADDIDRLKDMASDAPVIRLVNQLITAAAESRASDIHIEPMENALRIRLRIDGVLHQVDAPPQNLASAIVSRIKVMTKLNIAERRLPQDGRLRTSVRGKEIDLRVSTTPTAHGESVVLRILDRDQVKLDFSALGLEDEITAPLRRLLEEPHGILLVTGPTGSGKTTTLYAALTELNSVERKILTIEDPIEYQLDGINQVQVRPNIGLSFASALRSFLRQDPDIMMVGEIRDLETAQVAVQAALTGHLILSTLHTNDAASAVTRLLDMGVEDYLLTSTVNGVVAQRLVRTLCPQCREPYEPPAGFWERATPGISPLSEILYRPGACEACSHTGYRGRTAIVEVLSITDTIRQALLKSADAVAIQTLAVQGGMRPIRLHGFAKAAAGVTSVEEVLRVTRAV